MSDVQPIEPPVTAQPPAAGAPPAVTATATPAVVAKPDATPPAAKPAGTVAGGAKTEAVPAYWPEDWRDKVAAHVGGSDPKAVAKELKRLQRFVDPTGIYGTARELEAKFSEGGLVKIPGEKATPEDRAAFNKAMGVPEKPEEYFDLIKLPDGAVLGEADKPLADGFAKAVHAVGAPPAVVSAALGWYFKQQEDEAAKLDQADATFRQEGEAALRKEWGASFDRNVNAIASLFVNAPGGADADNPESLFSRLMAARTSDGKIVGNDPEMTKLLVGWAREVNPMATVTVSGGGTPSNRLAEIRALRKSDPDKYNADKKMQAEEVDLIAAELALNKRGKSA